MINRQGYGILFSSNLGPESQRFGVVESQLKEAALQKRKALDDLEGQLSALYTALQNIQAEALKPGNEADLNASDEIPQLHAGIQKQEVAIKTKLAQTRFNLSREKTKIEKEQNAFLAKLDQIYEQQAVDLRNLQNLKSRLASTLLSEIDRIRAQALSEENIGMVTADTNYLTFKSVVKFNKQFMGFAQIDSHGKYTLLRDLNQDFSQRKLKDIQQTMGNLLLQVNSTAWFTSDSLTQLATKIDTLSEQREYQALLGSKSSRRPAYRNGDVNFNWSSAAYKLETNCASILRQVGHAYYEQFQREGIDKLNADVESSTRELQSFQTLNENLNAKLKERRRLAAIFGDAEQAPVHGVELADPIATKEKQADKWTTKLTQSLTEVRALKARAKQTEFQLIDGSRVSDVAVDLAMLDLALENKLKRVTGGTTGSLALADESLSLDPDLCHKVAQTSYNTLKVEQAVRTAYDNNLPVEVAAKLTQNFSLQQTLAKNMTELLNPLENKSGKNNQTLRRESVVLLSQLNISLHELKAKTEAYQASQFCRLILNTLTNNNYWNKQLTLSFISSRLGGEAPALGAHVKHVPTGIAAMNKLVNTYNFTYRTKEDHWSNDPVLVRQFLGEIKAEAESRLNYKFLCFFNPGRDVHTSQFYKFLSQLDENQLTKETLLAAQKVHSIANATPVEMSPELRRAPLISV